MFIVIVVKYNPFSHGRNAELLCLAGEIADRRLLSSRGAENLLRGNTSKKYPRAAAIFLVFFFGVCDMLSIAVVTTCDRFASESWPGLGLVGS